MKVRPSVKPMCDKCKIIKRNGRVMVICIQVSQSQAKTGLANNFVRKRQPTFRFCGRPACVEDIKK